MHISPCVILSPFTHNFARLCPCCSASTPDVTQKLQFGFFFFKADCVLSQNKVFVGILGEILYSVFITYSHCFIKYSCNVYECVKALRWY